MAVQSTYCSYGKEANGVHRLTLHKANRVGLDQLLTYLRDIHDSTPQQETIRLLIDLRPDGIPPINYALPTLKQFFEDLTERSEMRAAYLYDSMALLSVAQTFLNLLRIKQSRRQFFKDEDEAVAWLLESNKPAAV